MGLESLRGNALGYANPTPDRFFASISTLLLPELNYHLDPVCLSPGNIILSRNSVKISSAAISRYQKHFEPDSNGSAWTHIAIVGKDSEIWEIVPKKHVRCVSLSEFCSDKAAVCIRKLRNISWDVEKLQANIHLLSKAKYPPMSPQTFIVYRRNLLKDGQNLPAFNEGDFNCALFVDRVIRSSASIDPCPASKSAIALPVHFATSDMFEDVPIHKLIYRVG